MASLLACFKAGIIAVPVFPPDPRRLQKDLHHFISIQSSSGATVALTHRVYNFAKKVSDIQGIFKSSKSLKWPDLRWIAVDDVLAKGKEKASSNTPGPTLSFIPKDDDTAFLQYTSGSTSDPKGVMISHGNLAHNLTLIIKELKADNSTINVSWLPQYHDMGLIGNIFFFIQQNTMEQSYVMPFYENRFIICYKTLASLMISRLKSIFTILLPLLLFCFFIFFYS